jgi:CIC family chloride channel protein
VLLGGLVTAPLLGLLFAFKLTATSLSLGSGSSGGIFSPSLFMGATLGGAFGAFAQTTLPWLNLSIPAFAMVGMAAMVGGGTGAAMTAVTMIFEMTRDYDIVMPMIIAVAVSIGVRRVLSHENIYTIKLVSRRHFIPKALHANMFLVHQARDVPTPQSMVNRKVNDDAVSPITRASQRIVPLAGAVYEGAVRFRIKPAVDTASR